MFVTGGDGGGERFQVGYVSALEILKKFRPLKEG